MTRHLPMLLKRRRQNKQVSRNAAGLVLLFGTLASVISGCGSKESNTETAQVPYEEAYQEEVSTGQESGNDTEVSAFHENEEYEAEEAEKEAEISYEVRDVSAVVLTEDAVDSALEDTWSPSSSVGMPNDTVEFVGSSEEEIMETVYEESTVDESDPSTYRIVEREETIPVTVETPTEYSDSSGKVKYSLQDGVWQEYSYSTGEVVLDSEDEELAMLLLNMDGSYDGYELVSVVCDRIEEEGNAAGYSYQVLYRKAEPLEGEPGETEHLTVTASVQTQTAETRVIQEKVPVMVEKEVPTGEYRYFGWQNENGHTCYYDENGERVTGDQVIKGLRYRFDENGYLISRTGVDVSSRNGAVDWDKVRNAGIGFVMIRAGYRGADNGRLILDAEAECNLSGAAAAGLDTGVYIFSQAVTEQEAIEEASLAVSLAGKYGTSMPIALKVDYSGPSYTGRADGLSPEDRTKIVRAFCTTVRNAGYEPMIFGGESWMANSLDLSETNHAQVWLTADGADHSSFGSFSIWQYTATGYVNGITGNAGINISCPAQQ